MFQVLNALRQVIVRDKLYDQKNPAIVLCDDELERILTAKALHTSEIR